MLGIAAIGLTGLATAAKPDQSKGKTGNGQDTYADVWFSNGSYGIKGDGVLTDGEWSYYPVNSGGESCVSTLVTDQAAGYVRMFVPAGNSDGCVNGPNRFLRIQSKYDLDQDGFCEIPYKGRADSGTFTRDYGCEGGVEPDGFEDVRYTMHLETVLGPGTETAITLQIRLLEYGDDYDPSLAVEDPTAEDLTFVGSQERAFNIKLSAPAVVQKEDPSNPEVRFFTNLDGHATICEVKWKNSHAHDCLDIVDANGDPVVIEGLTLRGKVYEIPPTSP